MSCIAPGWGSGPYGMTPWGGSLGGSPGGPIPVQGVFDVYCVGPCGPMSFITTYNEVLEDGDPLQFVILSPELDLQLGSGGSFPTDDVRLTISTPVPSSFTLEFTVKFDELPTNFTDLTYRHIFMGVSDAAGFCVGLFFSLGGLAYTGSVHHTGGVLADQNMVVDTVVQPLPNSETLITENEYWTYRIALDGLTGTVYLFITKTSELAVLGHQLRYVLPAILSSSATINPPDRTFISLRGTPGEPSVLSLDSICLGSTLIIPNLPPVADAGLDQAVRTCSIVQLNGSRSFDPEGGNIVYKWRLIDAPIGSQYIFDGVDGHTFDTFSDFTNKFYSPMLGVLDGDDPIVASLVNGDVLVVAGEAYTVEAKGTDGSGFYVQVPGFVLPDTLLNVSFKLLRQRGISGPTTVKPTFYPDLPGFFKFDLVVADLELMSEPSVMIISVTETPIPRGCIPDVSFIWGYLSDFWNFIPDRDHIQVFWSALAQIAASELLTIWQVDYNKSLRDVQRVFQRRWLHYDPLLEEVLPDGTKLRAVSQGCRTVELSTAGTTDYAGTVLTVSSPIFKTPFTYTFAGGTLTPSALLVGLSAALEAYDARYTLSLSEQQPLPATLNVLRLSAAFPFTIVHDSSVPLFLDFVNAAPGGSGGSGVGVRTYRVDRSLTGVDLQSGDVLVVDGEGYRIVRTITDPTDPWLNQRVILSEDLPFNTSATWQIVGKTTSLRLDFYQGLVVAGDRATYSVVHLASGEEGLFELPVSSAVSTEPKSMAVDLTSLSHFLADPGTFFVTFRQVRRFKYIPVEDVVMDIPYLQEKIINKDDETVLRRNVDFFIEPFRDSNSLRFVAEVWDVPPPDLMWAEVTYLDNRPAIEGNFGIPADFTLDDLSKLPSTTDYLSTVRGLWYAYFNGPTLFNLRAGTQILLGLPFAEEAGTITEIRSDFSPTQGRILVEDLSGSSIVRSYTYPADLGMEVNPVTGLPYVVGDQVPQFAPLVTGTIVVDYVKDPSWFQGYINQGSFFEIEKFFKFLVRVDSPAFSLSTLLFVRSFILRIKPTYTFPLFVVLRKVGDTEVSTVDLIEYSGRLLLNDGACYLNYYGEATMWDEPRPAGGGWRSQYDGDSDPTTVPTYPTSEVPVQWGFDKNYICPEDYIDAQVCIVWPGGVPTFDSIFAWDTEVFSAGAYNYEENWIFLVPLSGLILRDSPVTIAAPSTLTDVELTIVGDGGSGGTTYNIRIKVNGVTQATVPFDLAGVTYTTGYTLHATISVPIVATDTLSVVVEPAFGVPGRPFWKTITIELGNAVMWSYSTSLAAGTYCVYRAL